MHDDIDAAEAIPDRTGHGQAAFGGRDVRRHEQLGLRESAGRSARGRKDRRPFLAQTRDHRCADSLGAARDQRAAAFQPEFAAHG